MVGADAAAGTYNLAAGASPTFLPVCMSVHNTQYVWSMSALLQGRVCLHEGGQRRSGRALLLQDGRRHPPDRVRRPGHNRRAQRRRQLQVRAVSSRDWNSLCCYSFPQNNPSWAEYQTKIPMPAGSSPPYTVVMTFDSTTSIVSIAPHRVFSTDWSYFSGTATATAGR